MISPELAPVRPRVTAHDLEESVLLEDVVSRLINEQTLSTVYLVGNSGDGKSTALAHLAAVFQTEKVLLVDDEQGPVARETESRITAVACRKAPDSAQHVLHLTRWSDDDVIECVLRLYPGRAKSIMGRVLECPERHRVEGSPALWRIVLEQFAASDEIATCRAAVLRAWHLATKAEQRRWIARECFTFLCALHNGSHPADCEIAFLTRMAERTNNSLVVRLSAHQFVRNLLVAQWLATSLNDPGFLEVRWSRELVDDVASFVTEPDQANEHLLRYVTAPIVNRGAPRQAQIGAEILPSPRAMAASLLHGLSGKQLPPDCQHMTFQGANCTFHMGSTRSGLVDSPYPCEGSRTGFYTDDFGDQYFKSPEEIRKANLCGADLRGAQVEDADFYLVDLRGAVYDRVQGAHFERCRAILHDPE